jgi:hypothetical protein
MKPLTVLNYISKTIIKVGINLIWKDKYINHKLYDLKNIMNVIKTTLKTIIFILNSPSSFNNKDKYIKPITQILFKSFNKEYK